MIDRDKVISRERRSRRMTHPCENCKTRKFFAKRFDMHFFGEDCWYECEEYERWKEQQNDADAEDTEIPE